MKRPVGALIAKIIAQSPAEAADLQIGDIIVEFNGQKIETSGDLPPLVGMSPINEKSKLTVIRQGDKKVVSVKIGLLPEEDVQQAATKAAPKPDNRLGISVSNLNEEQREQTQVLKNGVLVQNVGKGPAAQVGIQRGDVILRIANNVIRDVADFDRIVKNLPAGQSIAVLIQRRGSPVFLAIKLDK
jgi:serine protease Do